MSQEVLTGAQSNQRHQRYATPCSSRPQNLLKSFPSAAKTNTTNPDRVGPKNFKTLYGRCSHLQHVYLCLQAQLVLHYAFSTNQALLVGNVAKSMASWHRVGYNGESAATASTTIVTPYRLHTYPTNHAQEGTKGGAKGLRVEGTRHSSSQHTSPTKNTNLWHTKNLPPSKMVRT